MNDPKKSDEFSVVNRCGRFFLRWKGTEMGPFSNERDAQAHLSTLRGGTGASSSPESRPPTSS